MGSCENGFNEILHLCKAMLRRCNEASHRWTLRAMQRALYCCNGALKWCNSALCTFKRVLSGSAPRRTRATSRRTECFQPLIGDLRGMFVVGVRSVFVVLILRPYPRRNTSEHLIRYSSANNR